MFKEIVIVTVLLVFCGTALVGCGDNEIKSPGSALTDMPGNTSGNAPNETQTDISADTPDDSSTDASEKAIEEDIVKESGNDVLKQLAFVYQDNTITISDIADDQKIEKMLGKADEIKSHTYSDNDGRNMDQLNGMTEKQYYFPGLVIKTINATEDKKFFIFSIIITDPKYQTIRNVKVGDSLEKLIEAYPEGKLLGDGLSGEEDDFRYEPVDYVDAMSFHIKDKKVESISMYKLLD